MEDIVPQGATGPSDNSSPGWSSVGQTHCALVQKMIVIEPQETPLIPTLSFKDRCWHSQLRLDYDLCAYSNL